MLSDQFLPFCLRKLVSKSVNNKYKTCLIENTNVGISFTFCNHKEYLTSNLWLLVLTFGHGFAQISGTHFLSISRLLLHMRRMYVSSVVWTFYHSQSYHMCFDNPSRETCAKHSAGAKSFWPSIVVTRTPPPLIITTYYYYYYQLACCLVLDGKQCYELYSDELSSFVGRCVWKSLALYL